MLQCNITAVLQNADSEVSNNGDEMKSRLYVMFGMLCMAFLLVGAVSATSETVRVVEGNKIASQFSMSIIPPSEVTIPLVAGVPQVITANSVSIGGNQAWKLSASDDMTKGKTAGSEGKMAQMIMSGEIPVWASGKILTNPLKVGVTTGSLIPLSGVPQILKQSSGASLYTGNLQFSQEVVLQDPVSETEQLYKYQIGVLFTGSLI